MYLFAQICRAKHVSTQFDLRSFSIITEALRTVNKAVSGLCELVCYPKLYTPILRKKGFIKGPLPD